MKYADICKNLALAGGRGEEIKGHSTQEVASVQACQVGKMRPPQKNEPWLPSLGSENLREILVSV